MPDTPPPPESRPSRPQTPDRNGTTLDIVSFPPNLGVIGAAGDEPYMLIKIFETVTGTYASNDPTDAIMRNGMAKALDFVTTPAGIAAAQKLNGKGNIESAVSAIFFGSETGQGIINDALKAGFGDPPDSTRDYISDAKGAIASFSMKRNEGKLTSCIGLFMPDAIHSDYAQNYQSMSLTETLGTFGFVAQALNSTSLKDVPNPYLIEGVSKAISQVTAMDASASKILTYSSTGMTVNPQLELLYTSPNFREFKLDFKFLPKNADEAKILFGDPSIASLTDNYSIITRLGILGALKYYSAPRIPTAPKDAGGGVVYGGRYFIPPAQFKLEFYNKGQLNTNLFKTKNCVLTNVNIDFTPGGYVTHEDGVPVEVRVQLSFKETALLNRADIDNGY